MSVFLNLKVLCLKRETVAVKNADFFPSLHPLKNNLALNAKKNT